MMLSSKHTLKNSIKYTEMLATNSKSPTPRFSESGRKFMLGTLEKSFEEEFLFYFLPRQLNTWDMRVH